MKLKGISQEGMKRLARKVKGQAEEQFLLQDTSGRYWTGSSWGVAEAAETFPRSELSMLDIDDKVNPENFFDNDTYDIGWGDEQGNIFVIAYPSEGKQASRRRAQAGYESLSIDWSQGQDDNGDQFGYITDGDGGYFFTWKDSLEAVLNSLEEDEMDRPSFPISSAADYLAESINNAPSSLKQRLARKVKAQEDLPDDAWDMGGDPGDPGNDRDDWMPDAEELVLYIDNTYELYGQKQSIQKSLIRKLNKGTYDAALAPKLWGYLAQEGAKRYVSEMGESFPGMPWHKVFPPQIRQEAAQEMAANFENEVDVAEGDLNEYFGV